MLEQSEIHHVAIYGMDLPGVQGALDTFFGIRPMKIEGLDAPEASATPILAIFEVGPTLLEFMQPRARFGINYDYVRRNGEPTVSHIAWKLVGIKERIHEMHERGADVWWTEPGISPHGGYYFDNIFAETTRGVKFQFCEDLAPEEISRVESEEFRTHTVGSRAIRYEASKGGVRGDDERVDAHRWLVRDGTSGVLKHVHHVCYHLWGVDYLVDYLAKILEVEPFKREDLPQIGLRGASFRFGHTIAQFEEPTTFDHSNADFALRFAPHSGLVGGGVSHVGWAVEDLDRTVAQLRREGLKFLQTQPVVSPHGGYRLIDADPQMSGGLKFQLCEDV